MLGSWGCRRRRRPAATRLDPRVADGPVLLARAPPRAAQSRGGDASGLLPGRRVRTRSRGGRSRRCRTTSRTPRSPSGCSSPCAPSRATSPPCCASCSWPTGGSWRPSPPHRAESLTRRPDRRRIAGVPAPRSPRSSAARTRLPSRRRWPPHRHGHGWWGPAGSARRGSRCGWPTTCTTGSPTVRAFVDLVHRVGAGRCRAGGGGRPGRGRAARTARWRRR